MSYLPATPAQAASLAKELCFEACVCDTIADTASDALFDRCREEILNLTQPETAPAAYETLTKRFEGSDADGMKMLCVYLAAACITRQKYREFGFSDDLFLASFGCLKRFLSETHRYTGRYAFDRSFWAWRQLSCRIVRLGALEFEYRLASENEPAIPGVAVGEPLLSVHIPSDAALSDDALRDSYDQAARFFAQQGKCLCTEGAPKVLTCGSWLLSLELRKLLSETSGIRRFADAYTIYAVDPDNESFYEWLFDKKKDLAEMPQKSSLQRKAAAHLAKGGKLGSARGVKKDFHLICAE